MHVQSEDIQMLSSRMDKFYKILSLYSHPVNYVLD